MPRIHARAAFRVHLLHVQWELHARGRHSTIRRRLHNGFQAQVQYTYSKSIDDATTPVAQNWLNLSGERGRSNLDQRNLAHITLQYTSGMGVGGGTLVGGWRGRLVKDWTLAASTNFGSGLPLTPIYSQLIPGTGIPGNLRASYTGAPLYEAPEGYFLNPAAVAVPPRSVGKCRQELHYRAGAILDDCFAVAGVPADRSVHPQPAG